MQHIEFTPTQVIKRQSLDAAVRERERTEVGRRIGTASGCFSVPRIEGFDPASGTLTFERVLDAERMTELLPTLTAVETSRISGRCGAALAAIHDAAESCPRDDAAAGQVSLHGDFALGNLLFSRARDKLFVIDWSGARWLEEARTGHGPAAIDLSIFLLSLFYRRPLDTVRVIDPARVARAFLASYNDARAAEYDFLELRRSFPGILRRYAADRWRARGALRMLVRLDALCHVRRFVLNLPEGLE